MISNKPWLVTVPQFGDKAVASAAVRLAPIGRLDADRLLELHLGKHLKSVSAIASDAVAIAELAALGSFDHSKLAIGAYRILKDRIRFMDCELPVGWFEPERRSVAPARLAADGENA